MCVRVYVRVRAKVVINESAEKQPRIMSGVGGLSYDLKVGHLLQGHLHTSMKSL